MATTNDDTNHQTTHLLAPAPIWGINDVSYPSDEPSDNVLQSGYTVEAQTHWIDESLAVSAFFTARQYPSELWQISSFPHLSTRELLDHVLDKKDLRRAIAFQVGVNVVTHCVPAVANILHRVGHQCLCRQSVQESTADVVNWLSQQVDSAVPECQWHAGATPYARVNYLMVLMEEVFRTLPISWSEVVAQSEGGGTVKNALKCINQAVRSANLEPQVMLGAWAAQNMIQDLQVSDQQTRSESQSTGNWDERNSQSLKARENANGIVPSPPDSQNAVCEDDASETGENDAVSLLYTPRDNGGVRASRQETTWKAIPSGPLKANTPHRPKLRRSRAPAPEYDMTRHPVDGALGDRVTNSRKRRRSQHSEDPHHIAKRRVSPFLIDD